MNIFSWTGLQPMPTTHPCERILVVDDDPSILQTLLEILEIEGLVVVGAHGAEQAVAVVDRGFCPSVILTDLMMPIRSGEQMIDELRRRPETRDIPIVAMSASPAELTAVRTKVAGALAKPFSIDDLVDLLAACCSQSRVLRRAVEPMG